jgi:PIN domain nuclease of toxin-antitoxin system
VEALIYLDTHLVAWLYALDEGRISPQATDALRAADDVRISPMVRLELQYLFEIGRVAQPPLPVLDHLTAILGLTVCEASSYAVAREAERHSWTRDPFDRLIVAQASLHDAPLLTANSTIRQHYSRAVW